MRLGEIVQVPTGSSLTLWPGGTGNSTAAPKSSFNFSSNLLPHSSTLLKSKSMSERLFGDGGVIRGYWAPENKDGPEVPGEGHPKASSILPCVLHALLLACYLPQLGCCEEPCLLVTFNCIICACELPYLNALQYICTS